MGERRAGPHLLEDRKVGEPLPLQGALDAGRRRDDERLIAALEAKGELGTTYVFFTSDNGFHMGEHGLTQGKVSPYEEDVRVPLLVRGPGMPASQTRDRFVLNNDFAPTFADLAGVVPPSFVDGRSFVALLDGDFSNDPPWRDAFLVEGWRHEPGFGSSSLVPTYKALRTQTRSYVEYATGEKELYDLTNDPHELRSRHRGSDPTALKRLHNRLEALKGCSGEVCRTAEEAP